MRKTLFFAILFPFAFWYVTVGRAQQTNPGSNAPAIIQKPLKGELAPLKLALNQPLKDWLKLLGDGKNIFNENGVDNIITFSFNAGRFTITVEFTGTSRLGTSAKISSKTGEPELTLKEATQIMESLGLTEPKKLVQDPNIDIQPLPDSRSWGTIPSSVETINDSSLVSAVYGAKDLEHRDNSRRALSIFTRQYLTPDS
jgi:hypothetical protein